MKTEMVSFLQHVEFMEVILIANQYGSMVCGVSLLSAVKGTPKC